MGSIKEFFVNLPLWVYIPAGAAVVFIIAVIIVAVCVGNSKKKKSVAKVEEARSEETLSELSENCNDTRTVEEERQTAEEVYTTQKVEEVQPEEETAAAETAEEKKPAAKKTSAPAKKPAAKSSASKPAAKKEDAKPAIKTYHISKRKENNMWQIKAAGGAKAIKLFKTQKEAIDYCKTLADNQDANIMIHKEDGSFRKLTY